MADGNRLACLDGWPGDLDASGSVGGGGVAGRHAHQQHGNGSGKRNRYDFDVGGWSAAKIVELFITATFRSLPRIGLI